MSDKEMSEIKVVLGKVETSLAENLKFISKQFEDMHKKIDHIGKSKAGSWTQPIVLMILGILLGLVSLPAFAAGTQMISAMIKSNIS